MAARVAEDTRRAYAGRLSPDPDQTGGKVRMRTLTAGRHLVGVEQRAVDDAEEPVPGGHLGAGGGPDDRVGLHLEPGAGRLAEIELHHAVRPDHRGFHVVALVHRAPETELTHRLADRLGVLVQQPGPGLVTQERPAVVADRDLLREVEVLRRREAALAAAAPHAD